MFYHEEFVFCNEFHDTVRPMRCDVCRPGGSSVSGEAVQFRGTYDATVKIIRHEGIGSLWRGLAPTLIMSVPATVIYYVGYENWKAGIERVAERDDRLKALASLAPLLSGGLARGLYDVMLPPAY